MTDRRNVRRINGDWEIVKYKQTDNLGFTTIIPAEGTFHFSKYKLKNKKGDFHYQFTYFSPLDTVSYNEFGAYYSSAKEEAFFLNTFDINGNIIQTEQFHIDILTTTDVILQYNDLTVMHTFVLRKKK
ncbi:MAG: hypothetical protein HYR91_14425 [Flavobacteriia bacterium]|nr:hypothetical protein [Flavobacteriia bacterium]